MAWWDEIPQDAGQNAQDNAANSAREAASLAAEGQMEAARIAAEESKRYQQEAIRYSQWGYGQALGQYAPWAARTFEESQYAPQLAWADTQQQRQIDRMQAARGLRGSGAGMRESLGASTNLRNTALEAYNQSRWQANQGIANAAIGVGSQQAGASNVAGQTLANVYSSLGNQLGQTYGNLSNNLTTQQGQNLQNQWNQQALQYANTQNAANRNLAWGNAALGAGRSIYDAYRQSQTPTQTTYNPSNNYSQGYTYDQGYYNTPYQWNTYGWGGPGGAADYGDLSFGY